MKLAPIVPLHKALTDWRYFGEQLAAGSWDSWKVLLLAIAGEELTASELAVFEGLAGLSAQPVHAPNEFFGVPQARRKEPCNSRLCVLARRLFRLASYPWPRRTRPVGHPRSTRDQAQGLFNFIAGAIDASSALRSMVIGQGADTLSLRSGVDITVRPGSFRSTRGTTLIAAIADELAWWKDDNSVPRLEDAPPQPRRSDCID